MQTVHTSDNVISLSHARGTRRSLAPKAEKAISDCRELALTRICDLVRRAFDQIEDDLFALAERTADRDLQSLYLDARAQAREKRAGIEDAFRQRFSGEFDGRVRGQPVESRAASPTLELSLVDDADLEESLALTSMANKLKSGAEEELSALTKRLGHLLDEPDLPGSANPLSPESVCSALKNACDQITAGYQVKLTLLRLFEQHVAKDLPQVYRDVNTRLVELHQVLPDIRVTYRAPVQPTQRTPAKPGMAPSQTPQPPGSAKGGGAKGDDMFALLQQLMGAPGGVIGGGALQLTPAPAAMIGTALPALATDQLMGRLTDLQHAKATAPLPAVAPGNAGQELVPANLADALNVLREIGARGLAQGASQVDSMTIDIVAMLFDYVFNDRQIPAAIKALLARLQIPVLKAALLDKGFFSHRTHPARVLLDGLAALAMQCDEDIGANHADHVFIEALVTRVQADFETDLAVFSDASASLAAFMDAREARGHVFDERSAKLLHDRERREIARLVAENAVDERLEGKILPPAVVIMLKARWVDVLRQAHLVGGEDGAAWNAGCQAVEDLAWSLTAQFGAEERKRLVAMLPRMLRIFQQGLAAIEVDPGERDRFFATLVAHHTAAVKSGLRPAPEKVGSDTQRLPALALVEASSVKVSPRAEEEDIELDPGEPGLMRIHLEADGVKVEELRLSQSTGRVVDTALPPSLVRGTWVEFRRPEGPLRAKLSWVSPHKGVLLFTNPTSAKAISLSPEVFALQLKDGLVRIFAEAPLSERAVESVLEDLRAA
ncbi:MAG: DUF1631 domain-containing protein [Betaproteobacteria bacterium]|nr:DUF1631 domain-containing protein [Betaproteobacteria bacterium]